MKSEIVYRPQEVIKPYRGRFAAGRAVGSGAEAKVAEIVLVEAPALPVVVKPENAAGKKIQKKAPKVGVVSDVPSGGSALVPDDMKAWLERQGLKVTRKEDRAKVAARVKRHRAKKGGGNAASK